MSIPYSGTFVRSGGVVSAIGKQLKSVNLKAVKRVNVKFDPFHDKVGHTRNFLHYITAPRIALTNPSCVIKTEIVCNREEPTVTFKLLPEIAEKLGTNSITLKAGNLTCLELLQLCNKYVTTLAPQEQQISTIKTKSEKSSGKRK